MFFYRDPEEVEAEQAAAAAAKLEAAEATETAAEPAGDWDASLPAISAQPAESKLCSIWYPSLASQSADLLLLFFLRRRLGR